MKKLKKWWKEKTYNNKVITFYIIIFILLYLLSVFNGLIINILFTLDYGNKETYVCFDFDAGYDCSFGEIIYNSLVIFPKFYFILVAPKFILNLPETISNLFEPIMKWQISSEYLQELHLFFIPILISIYYLSIPIVILYSLLKNKLKSKKIK